MNVSDLMISLWYFHLPNFILAIVMYTLLGRVLFGLIVDHEFQEFHLAFLLHLTDPFLKVFALVTPKATAPVVLWLFGFVWLFWLRVAIALPVSAVRPAAEGGYAMNERNFYYIGIAFFGMINGIFNQLALLFALIHVQVLCAGLAVRQRAAELISRH